MATKATISVKAVTAYSATLAVTVGSGYDAYRVFVRTGRSNETGSTVYDEIFTRGADFSVTVSGLAPGTTYSCNVQSRTATETVWYRAVQFTTADARPGAWAWRSDIRAGAALARAEGGKLLCVISWDEWIAFCENINAVRDYKGLSAYPFTVPVSGATPLSAAIVNEAREAIEAMSPPVAVPAVAGPGVTPISVALFNGLKDALNSIT